MDRMSTSPWVRRAQNNDLPSQAYAGTAAFERALVTQKRAGVTLTMKQVTKPCDHAFGITVDGVDQCAECRRVMPFPEALPPSLRDEVAMIAFPWKGLVLGILVFVVALVILVGGQS